MEDVRDLKERQIDALREVANIGAGHAATALSQLTNCRIMISVPEINIARLEEVPELIGNPQDVVAAVLMHMLGDLTGRTLLLFPEGVGRKLCDMLLRRPLGTTTVFDTLEQACLKEAGNILSGAYMNALSAFMGMLLLPPVLRPPDRPLRRRGPQQPRCPLLPEGAARGGDRGVRAGAGARPEDAGRPAQPRDRLPQLGLLRPARGGAAGAAAPGARRPGRPLGAGPGVRDPGAARRGDRGVRSPAGPPARRRGGDRAARSRREEPRPPEVATEWLLRARELDPNSSVVWFYLGE